MDEQRKIKILQDVIRIKSVNGDEREVAEYLQKLFAEYDIESELIPWNDTEDRANLVVTLQNGEGKTLGVSGHLDVVAAGDESQWRFPPYDAQIEGNKLYGRGSTDMKAGLVALVIAMIELKEAGLPFNGTIKALLTVGEEVGELGAMQLTELGYADDLDALLIAEPTAYNIAYAHKGSINYTVNSQGKSSHSSMPEEGINAINQLNSFIIKVNEAMADVTANYENEILGKFVHSITIILGGTQVNSIPEHASIQGNIRSIPEFANEETIDLLEKIIAEVNQGIAGELELVVDFNKQPVESDPASELIQSIQADFDDALPLIGISATTDAAEFTKAKKDFDVVIFGPGVPTLPHQVDEYVEIDQYLEFIEVFKRVFPDYLK